MFQLWHTRPSFKRLLVVGKWEWGTCTDQQMSSSVSPAKNSNNNAIMVAVVKSTATVVKETFGKVAVELSWINPEECEMSHWNVNHAVSRTCVFSC